MKHLWWLVLVLLAGCESKPQSADKAALEQVVRVPVSGPERRIVALGDSLFAGYGLQASQSYPARLEAALRARGINARIRNAGVSGDTSADGLARLKFTLDGWPGDSGAKPDLVLICLGGNDLLRSLPPAQTRANLAAILAELDRRRIKAMLMGMLAPPNLGKDYATQFDGLYPALAHRYHAALEPFILQAVIDHPELKQADHIHPTAPGVEAMVSATRENVVKALR